MAFVTIRRTRREIEADYDDRFLGDLVQVTFLDGLPDWDLTKEELADIEDQLAEQDFDRRHA
jgi:hypothetical protein